MILKTLRLTKHIIAKTADPVVRIKHRIAGCNFDKGVRIGRGSRLTRVSFGKYSGCNINCIINDTRVGSFVNIAWNVTIGPRGHIYKNFTSHDFIYTNGEHIYTGGIDVNYINSIGNDVWIGCNAIILPGVDVGDGAVIAAGSVVTKSIPKYAIVGGNPAKFIRWRFPQHVVQELERITWYDWDIDEIIARRDELERLVNFDISSFKAEYFAKRKDISTCTTN